MVGFHPLCYFAGILILSEQHPRVILYRSPEPILSPMLHVERYGIVPNVVFPTEINRRDDVGSPDRFDVYYGMADIQWRFSHRSAASVRCTRLCCSPAPRWNSQPARLNPFDALRHE